MKKHKTGKYQGHRSATLLAASLFLLFLASSCSESVVKLDNVGIKEAQEAIDFPIPESAKDIHVRLFAEGMQCMKLFFRCKVEIKEVDGAVDAIIKYHHEKFGTSLSFTKQPFSSGNLAFFIAKSKKIEWWNADNIKNGYYLGECSSFTPNIWVDNDNGLLYVFITD